MSSSPGPAGSGASRPAGDGEPGGPALTWESRWFFSGQPPESVVRALFPAGEAGDAALAAGDWSAPRTDRYLVFSPEMGIKLRDEPGRPVLLEMKGRLAPPEETRFGSAGVGMTDRWAKWSLPADGVPGGLEAAVRRGERVRFVTKTRLLSVLSLDPDGQVRPATRERRVARGVQLELSRVRVDRPPPEVTGAGSPGEPAGQRTGAPPSPRDPRAPYQAWSLSFEAFPLTPELPDRVRAAVIPWLERAARAGALLDRDRSAAYPAWLLARG